MSNVFKGHWQYLTVVIGLIMTLATSSYNYGVFQQKSCQMQMDISKYNSDNIQLAEEVEHLNVTLEKLITVIELQSGIKVREK